MGFNSAIKGLNLENKRKKKETQRLRINISAGFN